LNEKLNKLIEWWINGWMDDEVELEKLSDGICN
jgi:hypothetical protein